MTSIFMYGRFFCKRNTIIPTRATAIDEPITPISTTGTPPTGYAYGHERTTQADLLATGTDNSEQMHGTGVAGIAAGSGLGTTGVTGAICWATADRPKHRHAKTVKILFIMLTVST